MHWNFAWDFFLALDLLVGLFFGIGPFGWAFFWHWTFGWTFGWTFFEQIIQILLFFKILSYKEVLSHNTGFAFGARFPGCIGDRDALFTEESKIRTDWSSTITSTSARCRSLHAATSASSQQRVASSRCPVQVDGTGS